MPDLCPVHDSTLLHMSQWAKKQVVHIVVTCNEKDWQISGLLYILTVLFSPFFKQALRFSDVKKFCAWLCHY